MSINPDSLIMYTPDFIKQFRAQFPFYQNQTDKPISSVYLDNAATTHICQPALDAINHYYQFEHANVHRSSHPLAIGASNQFEAVRQQTAHWLNAIDKNEIVWTKGATEAANLIAHGLSKVHIKAGDEVIISLAEHHAHFVTWQQLAKYYNFNLKVVSLTQDLQIDLAHLSHLINPKTKAIAFCHVSNATGVIQPVDAILQLIKPHKQIVSIIDGSQAVNHIPINIQALNCDFYFFSAHKMHAGTGLGVCYGKQSWLNALPPYQFGGEMVKHVSLDDTQFNQLPFKFEAGTPNISAVIAFGATLKFLTQFQWQKIKVYENELMAYLLNELEQRKSINLLADDHLVGAVSFTVKDMHCKDASDILSQMGVALRAGSHCAMPLIQAICPQGSLRVSICGYTSVEDINYFLFCIDELNEFL
ncbi:cysteine desulfurase [Catenovulum sp. 2E275]|uniref:aminotransferase class V-fold PLP-dependent enzyme n=1 Tax=Catenovulum sp. 2E275 TaxID=2980497 RepID=UPI0021D1F0E2|nr:cysteine desulfurase [Catenovulum sp. 2E275]MCU4676494.1 cysteine desulfurase [Catenovulum sp. 2E275]